jgi:hypothetical protein
VSHVISVDVTVKDPKALAAAGDNCSMIDVDTPDWGWFGRWVNDYSADNAAYKNGITPAQYGKCEFALVQRDSPLGQAELAARAAGRRLTPAEVEAIRVKHYGKDWRTNTSKPYDVGVITNPAGPGYKLVYDFYSGGNGLRAKIGEDANTLRQHYSLETSKRVAARLGHRQLGVETLENGDIKLRVEVATKNKITLG